MVTLKSPHTLTLPSFFTGVTIWAAHPLEATFFITPSSSLNASSTAGFWASNTRQAIQNQGRALSLIWIWAWIFFILPKPSEKTLAWLLKTLSKAGMVSDVSKQSKGQFRRIDSNHSLPKRVGPSIFTAYIGSSLDCPWYSTVTWQMWRTYSKYTPLTHEWHRWTCFQLHGHWTTLKVDLKSDFLRMSRIRRHSRKIDFSFILPKHTFGWTYSRKNSLKFQRFILWPKFKKVRNLHIMAFSRLKIFKISHFFTKIAGA